MHITNDIEHLDLPATCVAVGVFDGVHLGHQAVLRQAVASAAESDSLPAALTFDPHPDEILRPRQAPRLLTTIAERAELIAAVGVEVILVARFDRELADLTPEDFARRILVARLGARCVVAGQGFVFGRGGSGSINTLTELGPRLGFRASAVGQVKAGGRVVSSTLVRELVSSGDMEAATELLGHCYTIGGAVVRGDRRGRTLDAPTANICVEERKLLPPNGVYAVRARLDGDPASAPGVANIGVRPTFGGDSASCVEAHLLDAGPTADLYARHISLEVVSRLRDERRFADAAALARQIRRDIADTRKLLG